MPVAFHEHVVEDPAPNTPVTAGVPGGELPRETRMVRLEVLAGQLTFSGASLFFGRPRTLPAGQGRTLTDAARGTTLKNVRFDTAAPGTRVRVVLFKW